MGCQKTTFNTRKQELALINRDENYDITEEDVVRFLCMLASERSIFDAFRDPARGPARGGPASR